MKNWLIFLVPEALRTKYEPDVEREEEELTVQSNSIPVDVARVCLFVL